jgi:hypothetical protein
MRSIALILAAIGIYLLWKVAIYGQWLYGYWSGFGYSIRDMIAKIGYIIRHGEPTMAVQHIVMAPIGIMLLVFALTLWLAARQFAARERSVAAAPR